ncbi:hypothetical protein [Phenylobacterium sp.]|uniref:hypothetical protein n=1 Tax=Phenylobacterium sp. TaxID=1871053 RepID=UPI00286A7097|nr:hypothetical protein [Phenylobacterium sp.]
MAEEFNVAELDEISRSFAEALFALYPQWRHLGVAQREQGDDHAYLELNVASPGGKERLLISTEGGEVTVDFGGYHSHFDWPPPEEDLLGHSNEPMAFIAGILTDQLFAASAWSGTEWRGSWPTSPGQKVPTADYVLAGAKTIRVRSWSGQQDADFALE